MKKYTIFAFILILALGLLAGCRNRNQNSTTPSTSQPVTVPTTAATTPDITGTEGGMDENMGNGTDATDNGLIPEMTGETGATNSNGT